MMSADDDAAFEWETPPLIKVFEALSALGGGHVVLDSGTHATVESSSGNKTYEVTNSADLRFVESNDNGSFWKGYLGYPALAVLMARGALTEEESLSSSLAGVRWKEINTHFGYSYDTALAAVLESTGIQGDALVNAMEYARDILEAVAARRWRGRSEHRIHPPTGF